MLRLARSSRIEIDLLRRQLTFFQGQRLSRTYPIAIGKPSTPSPVGQWEIINKKIIKHDSVFGSRWMGLSNPGYGIHGTNNPNSIGKAVSLGCIRMHNSNVEEIFPLISIGTPVTIHNGNGSNYTPPSKEEPSKPYPSPEKPKTTDKTYTIKAGDTLWKISNMLDIPLHQLIKANPNIDPENLQVGQVINLP